MRCSDRGPIGRPYHDGFHFAEFAESLRKVALQAGHFLEIDAEFERALNLGSNDGSDEAGALVELGGNRAIECADHMPADCQHGAPARATQQSDGACPVGPARRQRQATAAPE